MIKELFKEYKKQIIVAVAAVLVTATGNIFKKSNETDDVENTHKKEENPPVHVEIDKKKSDKDKINLNKVDSEKQTNSNIDQTEIFPTDKIDEAIKSNIENLILEFENKAVDATLKGIPELIKPYIYSQSNYYHEKSEDMLYIYNNYDYLSLENTNLFIKEIIRINETDYKVFADKTTIFNGKKKGAAFGSTEESRVEPFYIVTEDNNQFYIKTLEKVNTVYKRYS